MKNHVFKDSKICVVDDDPSNLEVFYDYLSTFGCNVLLAQSGERAIELAISEKPNLILLDILMPGMDGFSTCRKIKNNSEVCDIPIIFISALVDTVDKVKGFESGGIDFISKPFQHEETFARISTHLTLQKQKQELENTKTLLKNLIDSIPDPIFYKDSDGKYLGCNNSFAKIFNKDESEIVGKKEINDEKQNAVGIDNLKIFEKVLKGESERYYSNIQNDVNQSILFDTMLTPYQNNDDEIQGVIGVSRDITDLIRAEEALKESETRLSTILDSAAEGILTLNEEGIIDSFNATAELIFMYSESEVLNKNIQVILPEPYKSEYDSFLKKYLATGDEKYIFNSREIAGKRKNGVVFPMEISISEARINNKIIFTAIVRDITERKKVEEALRQSEKRFKDLFENSPDAIFVLDNDGIVLDTNPASCNLLKYEFENVVGSNLIDFYPTGLRKEVIKNYQKYFEGTEDYEEGVVWRSDGISISLDLKSTQVNYMGKSALLVQARDATERKAAELKLKESHEFLEAMVEERTSELKALYDQSPIGMAIFNTEGKIIEVNNSWEKIFSLNDYSDSYSLLEDEVLKMNNYSNSVRNVFTYGGHVITNPIGYLENEINKETKWLRHTFYSVHNTNGSVNRVVNLIEDVTEKKMQRLLRKNLIDKKLFLLQ